MLQFMITGIAFVFLLPQARANVFNNPSFHNMHGVVFKDHDVSEKFKTISKNGNVYWEKLDAGHSKALIVEKAQGKVTGLVYKSPDNMISRADFTEKARLKHMTRCEPSGECFAYNPTSCAQVREIVVKMGDEKINTCYSFFSGVKKILSTNAPASQQYEDMKIALRKIQEASQVTTPNPEFHSYQPSFPNIYAVHQTCTNIKDHFAAAETSGVPAANRSGNQ